MREAKLTCKAKRGERKLKWEAVANVPESLDEFVQVSGTPERALAYIVESCISDARSVGNARVRNAEAEESDETAITAAQSLSSAQNPSIVRVRGRKPGEKTQKVKALDELVALQAAGNLDPDKVAEILKRFGGA